MESAFDLESLRWLIELAMGTVSALAGWIVGKRKRNNSFLGELQGSIDMLAAKNGEQLNEILKLRDEVIKLRAENLSQSKEIEHVRSENRLLGEQIRALRDENAELNSKVQTLTEQLAGVKTITKK